MAKHLTFTILFQGRNLNYGESVGTVGTLKKHYRDGRVHSYLSRQALRYSLIEILASWDKKWKTKVEGEGKTLQYSYSATIKDNPELDLFGYMKTKSSKDKKKEGEDSKEKTMLRPAPVRISDATSLEAWNSETAFNNNMGLMRRTGSDSLGLIPYQYESHMSWYTYTVTIDLENIGKNENSEEVVIDEKERFKRISTLLDGIKCLYRDIRGRREDLSPIFIIGGVTGTGNPIFYNLLKVDYKNNADTLNVETIKSRMNITAPPENKPIRDEIRVGFTSGIFGNEGDIKNLPNATTVEEFFNAIKQDISKVYGVA
ncbi:MAG: type I-B CRISPR-associated protein Cas7/Cst2/DevR [Deferribacteraceae bacterium]|jgi:CRISPR-associated protein Cst2|nr:type I-B CRISPR-associated protein Cas7/Cst2/DevR [Deferribacteraceae bacterium]